MFGLDTIFILGYAVLAGAVANRNRNNENNNHWQEQTVHYDAPSYPTSSSSSSSVHANPDYFEKRTIWDWYYNGLTGEERDILLENGYSDRSGCFRLEELKSVSERLFAEKAPGKPTEEDGFKPKKKIEMAKL